MIGSPPAPDFTTWAIVVTAGGYDARQIPLARIGAPEVIAIHPSKTSAAAGLRRVRIAGGVRLPRARHARPYARQLRESIARAIREVALPCPQQDDPALA